MKKLLLALSLISFFSISSAHGPYRAFGMHGGYYGGGCGGCWIAPAVIGGVVGYELTRPTTVYVEPQPSVIVQQSQTVVQAPPVGYHWQDMIDPQTGVHKIVAVPN